MTSLKVLVIGSDNRLRNAILQVLCSKPSLEVIGQAESVVEAITYAYLMRPDIVFVEAGFSGVSELGVASWIKRFSPHTKIVFLSQPRDIPNGIPCGSEETDGYILPARLEQELPAFLENLKERRSGSVSLTASVGSQGA